MTTNSAMNSANQPLKKENSANSQKRDSIVSATRN